MAPKKKAASKKRSKKAGETVEVDGRMFFDELGGAAFSRAFHSHIQELAYERLKDPDYQEWMSEWLEGFLSSIVEKLRAERLARARKAKKRKSR
jgi:hypothetical protein